MVDTLYIDVGMFRSGGEDCEYPVILAVDNTGTVYYRFDSLEHFKEWAPSSYVLQDRVLDDPTFCGRDCRVRLEDGSGFADVLLTGYNEVMAM